MKKGIYILIFILTVASVLRLVSLSEYPDGFHQDEAFNLWNSYCLVKTGHDQAGVSWPIFYARGLGANYSTLFLYILLPFTGTLGLHVYTSRLAAALLGIITVFLTYIAGKRLFNHYAGLAGAGILCVAPWHLHLSRLAHEGCVCPFSVMAFITLLLMSHLSLDDNDRGVPRPVFASLAGLVAGISCYAYQPNRIFYPFFLLFLLLLNLRDFINLIKNRRGFLSVLVFTVVFFLVFAPLIYMHIADPHGINRHGDRQMLWKSMNLSAVQVVAGIIYRYLNHFNPYYLFVQSEKIVNYFPDAIIFQLYMMPLAISGMIFLIYRIKHSKSARFLLAFLLAYPISDSLGVFQSPNPLRSAPGMISLVLLSAFGAVHGFQYLWKKKKNLAYVITAFISFLFIVNNIWYLYFYFFIANNLPGYYHLYQADLKEACLWLKPRINEADAVFVTTNGMNQPYILSLVYLAYEPEQWLKDEHLIYTPGEWDIHVRYGKMNFIYGDSWLPAISKLQENGKNDRVIFILRPEELHLTDPVYEIKERAGNPCLYIYDKVL
ncbi:MAG: hypothetical protein ABRQ39_16165 [Candidatus Eremiobacterota bacterium]